MRIVQVYGVWEVRVRVYKQREGRMMEKEVEREAGQDLQIGLLDSLVRESSPCPMVCPG